MATKTTKTEAPETETVGEVQPLPSPVLPNWDVLRKAFLDPFKPEDVEFRSLRYVERTSQHEIAAYLSAAAIMDRLDEIVGCENWEFEVIPVVLDIVEQKITRWDAVQNQKVTITVPVKEMTRAKGVLKIHGVSKSSMGDSSNTSPTKGCDSDALKRAAVLWGFGRYLRDIPRMYLPQGAVDYGHIEAQAVEYLRTKIPRSADYDGPCTLANYCEAYPDDGHAAGELAAMSGGEPEERTAPLSRQVQKEVVDDTEKRGKALADFALAVREKQLPTGDDMEEWQDYAIAVYLKCGNVDAKLDKLATNQIVNVTGAIRAGRIKWPESTNVD